MRKMTLAVLLSLLILVFLAGTTALGDGFVTAEGTEIPDRIQSYLKKEKLDGFTAISCVTGAGHSADYAFVLMQGKGGNSILYAFRKKGKDWNYQFKTGSGIPQGTGRTIVLGNSGFDEITVAEENDSGEYWVKYANYSLRKNGTWCLREYCDRSRKMNVTVSDNRIAYYGGADYDEFEGYVYGTIQNELRYANLSNIPATLKEAKKKYTLAPALPAGSLSADVIKFTGGKRYEVYTAPGEDSVRGGNGKAAVSTNDWIQVFGQENGWILIQYAIDASHYRIGYISAKALPKKAEVQELVFSHGAAWTVRDTVLTDDPLFSRSAVLSMPEGSPMVWLGTMGDWAYVEVNQNDLARGFVPIADITAKRTFILENQPDDNGNPVYNGQLTITQDGRMEASLAIAPDGPLAGTAPETIQVLDSFNGALLTILYREDDGRYYGSGLLNESVTSLTLTAMDAEGQAFAPILRVEW